MVETYPGGTLVEVGTYLGRSLCALGTLVRDSGKPFRVVGVDWCLGSGEENGHDHHADAVRRGRGNFAGELWENVIGCGLSGIVSLAIGESTQVSELFPDDSLTMVFLDGRHDAVCLESDVRDWYPKVRLRGELAGDDYGTEDPRPFPDVKRVVDSLLPGRRLVPHDVWCLRKGSLGVRL